MLREGLNLAKCILVYLRVSVSALKNFNLEGVYCFKPAQKYQTRSHIVLYGTKMFTKPNRFRKCMLC